MLNSDLSPEELQKAIAAAKSGRKVPDGPVIACFQPEELAAAIESEIGRTSNLQNQKITLHMDPIDAMLLAKFLRFRSL